MATNKEIKYTNKEKITNCKECNGEFTNERKYVARGYCRSCYNKQYYNKESDIYIDKASTTCKVCSIEITGKRCKGMCIKCYTIEWKKEDTSGLKKWKKEQRRKVELEKLNILQSFITKIKKQYYLIDLFDINDIITYWQDFTKGDINKYDKLHFGRQIKNMWDDLVELNKWNWDDDKKDKHKIREKKNKYERERRRRKKQIKKQI